MSDQPEITTFKLIPDDHILRGKKPCPYCGGEISCYANAWEDAEDGSGYIATDLEIECSNEPDLDDAEAWEDWDQQHGRADYNEAWHELHERLKRAINSRFRFDMQNGGGEVGPPEAGPLSTTLLPGRDRTI